MLSVLVFGCLPILRHCVGCPTCKICGQADENADHLFTGCYLASVLWQKAKPPCSFTKEETGYLTKRIQDGGTKVVQAKAGAGSTTLSMAYATVKFADRYLRGLRGDVDIVDCAFVESRVTELPFFATQVRLGHTGVEEIYQLGPLNEYERYALKHMKEGSTIINTTSVNAYKGNATFFL